MIRKIIFVIVILTLLVSSTSSSTSDLNFEGLVIPEQDFKSLTEHVVPLQSFYLCSIKQDECVRLVKLKDG
jgi:hypothetical protein